MRIIYRISDVGYSKVKPDYINNENCLANASKEFDDSIWSVIADNIYKDNNVEIESINFWSEYIISNVDYINNRSLEQNIDNFFGFKQLNV